jgi:hypothetical protein
VEQQLMDKLHVLTYLGTVPVTRRYLRCPMKSLFFSVAFALLLAGCKSRHASLFERLSPGETGIAFNNVLTDNDSLNILEYTYYYNGGGVGIGDVNNDGLADIYFTGNEVSGKLYLNRGTGSLRTLPKRPASPPTAGRGASRWST